jgi:hypothetical protein
MACLLIGVSMIIPALYYRACWKSSETRLGNMKKKLGNMEANLHLWENWGE